MSLFKRLFGPDEPEEAPDSEVAIEPAQDQSLFPMTPGELAALESSSRSVTLPAGERVAAAAAGYRKAPNAAGSPTPGSVGLQGNLARAHEEIPRPKRPSARNSLKPEDRQP